MRDSVSRTDQPCVVHRKLLNRNEEIVVLQGENTREDKLLLVGAPFEVEGSIWVVEVPVGE
jgi:hypothetical protein